ncbi:hypothetical protein ACUWEX_00870 [Okibacterium fritillariae]|uniref:hypothetical protein n=1 Tax=Okibacterium fritillariae TaxID=123320 RepID=UPI004055844E
MNLLVAIVETPFAPKFPLIRPPFIVVVALVLIAPEAELPFLYVLHDAFAEAVDPAISANTRARLDTARGRNCCLFDFTLQIAFGYRQKGKNRREHTN